MRFILFSFCVPLFCLEIGAAKADSIIDREKQIQVLEQTRFLYDILGEKKTAKIRLQQFHKKTDDSRFKANTYFFLAKIFDRDRMPDSAVFYYNKALKHPKEIEQHLNYIYSRLTDLKPESIKSISSQKSNIHRIERIYPYTKKGKVEHLLQIDRKKTASINAHPEFVRLDAKANLQPLKLPIERGQTIVDACSDFYLSSDKNSLLLNKFSSSKNEKVTSLTEVLHSGQILSCEAEEFIIIFPKHIDYYEHRSLLKSTPLAKGCKFKYLDKNKHMAVINCRDSILSTLDYKSGRISRLPAEDHRPFFITSGYNLLVVQYTDIFVVYGGVNYQKILWKSHSKISDKIYLTEEELIQIDEKGNVTMRKNLSGEKSWRKSLGARDFIKTQKGLCFLTHYNGCVGTDLAGKVTWTYEFGWEPGTTPLYSNEVIAFFYPNGTLLKLNINLMKFYSKTSTKTLNDHISNFSKINCTNIIKYSETIINREPGNGTAWKLKYKCAEELKYPGIDQLFSLTQAAKSFVTPPLKSSPILKALNKKLKSKWIWKRTYGPKFYPHLITHKNKLLYIENDNQTLVILDSQAGDLIRKIHISEELDSKLCHWSKGRIIISSPKRIYFIPTESGRSGTKSFSIKSPICESLIVNGDLLISDWSGNLTRINIRPDSDAAAVWSVKLSDKGLLINSGSEDNLIDVVGIHGEYFVVNVNNGSTVFNIDLPRGTVTDIHSSGGLMFAGYDNGLLICAEKSTKKVRWKHKFSNQIFSLTGNNSGILIVSTASKKFICIDSRTGDLQKSITLNTSLINKPVVTSNGYWIGTTEPALEKRTFSHKLARKFQLTGIPGNPVINDTLLFISTLDGFINSFELE